MLTAPAIERMNLGRVVPVPPGLSVRSTLRAISTLLHRHEALRSRFHLDESGRPCQIVAGRGELAVEEYEAAGSDCRDAARAAKDRLCAVPFTVPEIPLRVTLISEQQRPVMLAVCVFHLATDTWGMRLIVDDLISILDSLRDRSPDQLPGLPAQISERLEYERSEQGVKRSHRALEYWTEQISRFPESALPVAAGKSEGGHFRDLHMESVALSVACRSLAHKFKVSVGSLFTGLAAVLLCSINENPGVGFLVFTHNRYGRQWAGLSGPLVQDFPMYVEVAGRTLLEVCRDIDSMRLRGSFHGQYDPADLPAVFADTAESVGFTPDVSCAVNTKLTQETGSPAHGMNGPGSWTRQALEVLTGETRINVGAVVHREDMNLFLSVDCRPRRTAILMRANTGIFSLDQMRDFLMSLEASALKNLVVC